MALIRYATREITAKLVYYGPGLSGKTSNLQHIHSKRAFGKVGELLSLATGGDRTLFFDLLPVSAGTIAGFTLRFQLFTVPGQIFYNKTRKMVLRDADGVVLVADSASDARERNRESLENLKQNLLENGLEYDTIPLVLQLNKRDLTGPQQIADMNAQLNDRNVQVFEAIATRGIGVVETLQALMRIVLSDLDRKYNLYRAKGSEESESLTNFELGIPTGETAAAATSTSVNLATERPDGDAAFSSAPVGASRHTSVRTDEVGPEAHPTAHQASAGLTDLLAQTVARLETLTSELRTANHHQVHAQERNKAELLDAIEALRAPGLMTIEEAARYLRVPPGKLEELASQGAIPCTRLDSDGEWLFTRALLDEWITKRSLGTG